MTDTYGVAEFVADARRIVEAPGGVKDSEAAVRALEPLLRRALGSPGWDDPRYATVRLRAVGRVSTTTATRTGRSTSTVCCSPPSGRRRSTTT